MARHTLHIFTVILLIISLFACKKTKATFVNNGSLQFDSTTYTLKTARQHTYIDTTSGEHRIDLALCTPKMTYTDGRMSGTGALVIITVACDTAQLRPDTYDLCAESRITVISDDKTDTTTAAIGQGTLTVEASEHGQRYTIKTDRLKGSYEGTCTHFYDIDGTPIGTLIVGDSVVSLQRGDLLLWGPIFAAEINYYEFYFYSCNLRYSDAGAIKQGTVFVVGLHAATPDAPPDGDYPISTENRANTALYGHKSGNGSWGTYRNTYQSASAQAKANVLSGTIAVKHTNNGTYTFNFDCTDQLKTTITGNYTGDFRQIEVK